MKLSRWSVPAACFLFALASASFLPGCSDGKGETGTQVKVDHDPQKDREQHEINQKKYMEQMRKQGRKK